MNKFSDIMQQFFDDFETYAYYQGNLHFSHLINALQFIQNEKSLSTQDKDFCITIRQEGETFRLGDIQGTPAFVKFMNANHRSKTKVSFLALLETWVEFAARFDLLTNNDSIAIENGTIHLNFNSFTSKRLRDIQVTPGFENLDIANLN